MTDTAKTKADEAIHLAIVALTLSVVAAGLPAALTSGYFSYGTPSGAFAEYATPVRDFSVVEFVAYLWRGTVSGLLGWFSPMVLSIRLLARHMRSAISYATISILIGMINLFIVCNQYDIRLGASDPSLYVLVALTVAGSAIGGAYLARNPNRLTEV